MRPALCNSASTELAYEPCRTSIAGESHAFLVTGFAAAVIIIALSDGKKVKKRSFDRPT
jgi:hypothetical protein